MNTATANTSAVILVLVSIGDLFAMVAQMTTLQWNWGLMRGLLTATAGIFIYLEKRRSTNGRDATPNSPSSTVGGTINSPLSTKLAAGFFGGLIGGAIAGLLFGIYYYFHAVHPKPTLKAIEVIVEIVAYAIVVGIVAGAASQLAVHGIRRFLSNGLPSPFNELLGSTVAAAIGGCLVGMLGADRFALRPLAPFSYEWLISCVTFGTCWIAFGAIMYEHKLEWTSAVWALAIVTGVAIVAAFVGLQILRSVNVDFAKTQTVQTARQAGAIVGLVTGALMGLQIAATQIVYRVISARRPAS